MRRREVKIKMLEAYKDLMCPHRYKVFYGGRGGGKTYNFCAAIIIKIMNAPLFIVCFREFGLTLAESAKKQLESIINESGLSAFFIITENKIRCKNGGYIIFMGLGRNIMNIKSLADIDIAWIEEGSTIKEEALDLVWPTVRKENSEVWISFNPMTTEDAVYKIFVIDKSKSGAYVRKVNYDENKYLSQAIYQDIEDDKNFSYEKYRHIWLGFPGFSRHAILKKDWFWYYESIEDIKKYISFIFLTADTAYKAGQHNDYSVIQCWGCQGGHKLFLLDQVRGKWEFPMLLANLREIWKKWTYRAGMLKPHAIYTEDKASGTSLCQTAKQAGIPTRLWTPTAFKYPIDKVGRVHEASWLLKNGSVFVPKKSEFTDKFITECCEFSSDNSHMHDDQVDAFTMATSIWRFHGGGIRQNTPKGEKPKKG